MLPERVDNLEIIRWPDPRLKAPGKRIEVFDERLKALADRMIELMHESNGVGLAAPQIGLNLQLFVARAPGQMDEPLAYVNAELTERGGTITSEEGCLSAPGITIKTKRVGKIGIRAQDLKGEYFEQEADGLLARVWQHEVDHCNGVVIVDRMSRLQRITCRRAIQELKEAHEQANQS
ncbi:MAG: peptide deformylase [Actinobacteria bacterium]|nr:peptide deformylase [Actinomycetota bacterium]